jgi:competence protein ComEC
MALVALASACLGVARAQPARIVPVELPTEGIMLQLRGIVDAEPDVRDLSEHLTVRLEQDRTGSRWGSAAGAILVQVPRRQMAAYGDLVQFTGVLTTPSTHGATDFDYRAYLARQGIGAVVRYPTAFHVMARRQGSPILTAVFAVRARLEAQASAMLPEPQASLLRACLIGTRSATFADLTPDFIATGMIHVIATSGFKVNIVASALLWLCTWVLGRRRAAIPCLLGVACYIAITGATPAGLRAGLMWAAAISAALVGRRNASRQALALSAALMALLTPALLFDTGFLLSAAATAGLVVLGPSLEPWLVRVPRWAAEPVGATVAAQLTTLPIMVVGFQQISLVSPLANLLCLPVLPAIMFLGSLAEAAAFVSPTLGAALAWLVWVPLTYFIDVVHVLAKLPFAARPASGQGAVVTVAYYALLIVLFQLLPKPPERSVTPASDRGLTPALGRMTLGAHNKPSPESGKASKPWWEAWAWTAVAAAGLSAMVIAATVVTFRRDGLLHVAVLDVGQGDATLLTDPEGRHILINGGPNPNTLVVRLGRHIAPWDRRLVLLVVTSLRQDELAGATSIVSRYRPSSILAPRGGTGAGYEEWRKQTALAGVTVQEVTEPMVLDLGRGARLELLPVEASAADKNTAVLAIRAVYGNSTAVLGGNLSIRDQHWLVETNAPITGTLLVLPRNGGAQSLAPDFLQAVDPHVAVISAGQTSRGDAPSVDTLGQLGDVPVYHTDESGTLEFVSNGQEWARR